MWLNWGRARTRIGIGTLILSGITALAVVASDMPAEAGFLKNGVRPGNRSKMTIVRRPSPGTRKRIFAPGERRPAPRARQPRSAQHKWFWKIHATAATAGRPDRWDAALKTMTERRAGGKLIADIDNLRLISRTFGAEISKAARTSGVSELLLLAVISVESRGKLKAKSHKGAQGLMQLIPATAKRFSVTDPYDAAQNIGGGAAYLNWLLREFGGDPLLALAGYNAGEGAVRKHKGIPPYSETRDYVVKVFDALAAAQALCAAPVKTPRQRCLLVPGTG